LFEFFRKSGLYPESSGIVGNSFYDPYYSSFVNLISGANALEERWWNQSEPVWLTAKNQASEFDIVFEL